MPEFKALSQALQGQLVQWRRWFHQHPGIGFDVQETADYILKKLADWGIEAEAGVGGTGVVAVIRGGKPGPTIAVRVDIDALPIQEENTHDFISLYPGKMHACGHDAHAAIGLGVARLLAEQREDLSGAAVIIFQPAEERGGGAAVMIRDGVLDRYGVQAIVGGHIGLLSPALSRGQVGISYGPLMAAACQFEAEIMGKGGHGAYPHETIDPVVVSAEVISAWQRLVSRELSPLHPGVLSVGSIHGGDAHNIIPEKVVMKGTFRYFQPQAGEIFLHRVEEVLAGICKAWKTRYTYKIGTAYPPLINDQDFTAFFAQVARGLVGEENVKVIEPVMGGEDMAFFLEQVPGTYYFLGAGNPEKGIVHPHHHPRFDIDEDVLWLGVALLSQTVWEYTRNFKADKTK
jgi:amidohydrolase